MRWVNPVLAGALCGSVILFAVSVYRLGSALELVQQCSRKVSLMEWHLQAAREMAPAQMREVDAYVDGVLAQMEGER